MAPGSLANNRTQRQRADVLIAGDQTDGRIALVEILVLRDDEPPRHVHHWEDEVIYVLSGSLRVWIAGTWIEAAPGAAVFVSRGVEHGFLSTTDESRILAVVSPAGFERYFQDLAAAPEMPDLDRRIALAARYGSEVTGPPVRAEL